MKITKIAMVSLKKAAARIQFNRERKRWHRKIDRLYSNVLAETDNKVPLDIPGHKKRWSRLVKDVYPRWYETYSYSSGNADIDYVPEDIFYSVIVPIMNRRSFTDAYSDKNIYDKLFRSRPGIFPDVVLRCMEGGFYDKDYAPVNDPSDLLENLKNEKIVVKPSIESGGGKSIHFFQRDRGRLIDSQGRILSVDFLKKNCGNKCGNNGNNYSNNYIVQDYIRQHDYFKNLNESSLNTVRIMTYRSVKTEDVVVLHSALRMGTAGSGTDNVSTGGVACIVHKNGSLNPFAKNFFGKKYLTHPTNPQLTFGSLDRVHQFTQMTDAAKSIARENQYFRLLGFDFSVDQEGRIRLVEINMGGLGINLFQFADGSLFKEYTDEVIDYCSQRLPL